MADIGRKTYKRNGMERIIDSDGILRLNEKQIEEELDHKNLREIPIKYHSDQRRPKCNLWRNQRNNAIEFL